MPYSNIDKPSKYFNTKLYTGNSNATQTISGVGFQPDMTWIKCRSDIENHHLADAVRGANKFLFTNATNSERTGSENDGHNVMAFTSDGFSLTNTSALDDELNFGSRTYCSWNWKANGAGVSNTSGTISSTVSANTTSGFSIVSYTGTGATATVGHGLGVTPKVIIVKKRDSAGTDWTVWGSILGGTVGSEKITLNGTGAKSTGLNSSWFNNTAPTSTLFTVGTQSDVNGSGGTYIGYCFAEVKGFSKFGSYTGNASSSGNFIYTGFKPAFVLIKPTSSIDNWWIIDNKRDGYNKQYKLISPNLSSAEDTANAGVTDMDLLSNGFRLTTNWSGWNNSGQTVMYACFAESPFVSSKGIPTTAR